MEESDYEEISIDIDDVSDNEENTGIKNCLEHLKTLENVQVSDFVYVGLKKN